MMILRVFSSTAASVKTMNYEAHFSSESFPILMFWIERSSRREQRVTGPAASPLCFIALGLIHWVILKWRFSTWHHRHYLTFSEGITKPGCVKWVKYSISYTDPFHKSAFLHSFKVNMMETFLFRIDSICCIQRLVFLHSLTQHGYKLLQQMENNGNKSPHFHL